MSADLPPGTGSANREKPVDTVPAMEAQPRGFRQVAVPLVAFRAGGQALEFIGFIILARRLGTSDFGTLSVAFLVCRYAGLVADWGASLKGTRDVAAGRHDGLHALVRRRELVTAGMIVLYAVVVVAIDKPALLPLAACIAGRGLNRDWFALGRERGVRAGIPPLVQGALLCAGVLFVSGLLGASLAVGLAYGIGTLLSVLLNRLPQPRPLGTGQTSVEGWLLLAMLSDQVFLTIDTLLLAALVNTSTAGIYSAIYRLPNAWMTAVGLLITGLLPGVTRRLHDDPDRLREMRGRALQIGLRFALLVLVSIPVGYWLVPIVLGPAYTSGQVPMVILLVGSALMTATAGLAPIYYAIHPDKHIALWMAMTGTLNLVANVIVIPTYGMVGAACVTVASQVLLSGFLFLRTRVRAV